jgi:hypothetical protein
VHLEKCDAEHNTPPTWQPHALVSEEEEEEKMPKLYGKEGGKRE